MKFLALAAGTLGRQSISDSRVHIARRTETEIITVSNGCGVLTSVHQSPGLSQILYLRTDSRCLTHDLLTAIVTSPSGILSVGLWDGYTEAKTSHVLFVLACVSLLCFCDVRVGHLTDPKGRDLGIITDGDTA